MWEGNETQKSRRLKTTPKYLNDYETYNATMSAYTTMLSDVPSSFEEAYQDTEWKKSIEEA